MYVHHTIESSTLAMYSVHCEAGYMYIDLTIELGEECWYVHSAIHAQPLFPMGLLILLSVFPLNCSSPPFLCPSLSLCSTSIVEVSLSSNIYWTLRM